MIAKYGFLTLVIFLGSTPQETRDYAAEAKQVVSDLAAHRSSDLEKRFTPQMTAALPPGKLGQVWDGLVGQVGPLKEVTGAKASEQQGYHVVVVSCKFEKASLDASVTFDAEGRLAGLRFLPHAPETPWAPPAYADLKSFNERPVSVGSGRWQLPGTLSLPNGQGPFPAVVLVQGSGPHDEDETIGPNKPFKDLAYGLASRRVAVLRYVKRTLKYGGAIASQLSNFTVMDETVDDARAAVALLAGMTEIDPHRIVVLGHSLGGMMAPRIAAGNAQVAGIIILAGTTRPLEQVMVEQIRYLASLQGTPTAQAEQQIHQAEQTAKEIESPALTAKQTVTVLGAATPGSYWLDLRAYHPAEVAAQLKIPILVLQGERDYQVTREDFNGWKTALQSDRLASFKLYPDLMHLFMPSAAPGSGPGTPADYERPGHVDEAVIRDIADWVRAQAGGKP